MIEDEFARWQQGGCLGYAIALLRLRPDLQFGSLYDDEGIAQHHFAYDERFAYDSTGSHPLPYLGIDGWAAECALGEDPGWYDAPDESEVLAATLHAERNRILDPS